MDLAAYTPLIIATLVLMIKPGPLVMTYISMALAGRWRSIIAFWFGYFIFINTAYVFFLSTLSMLPPGFGMVFIFIKSIASIMFIWLGMHGLAKALSGDFTTKEDGQELSNKLAKENYFKNFMTGGVLSLSNPYDYIFILTVVPALMGTSQFTGIDIGMIIAITSLGHIIVNGAYILPIVIFRKFIPARMMKGIHIASSALMILIGLYVFATIFFRSGLEESQLLSMITVSEGA